MIITSPTSLHYPVTVTELLKQPNDKVERFAPLFSYYYTTTVTEGREQKQVERKYPARFESTIDGTITSWKIAAGTIIARPGISLVDIEEPCTHEIQFAGLCVNCGKDMTEINPVTAKTNEDRAPNHAAHGNVQLKVSQSESERRDDENKRRLLANRKLSLVVDLDQTIIQATVDPTIAEWQNDESNPNHEAVKDVRKFQLIDDGPGGRGCWYYIKFRPGLEQFLEEISKLYELHIYTMGTRAYAQNIAKLIDPQRKRFGDRILSRDESGSLTAKTLDRIFPVNHKMVVIIDDRGDIWHWVDNLIKVNPFEFFVGIGDINSSFLPKRTEQLAREANIARVDAKESTGTNEAGIEAASAPTSDAGQEVSNPTGNPAAPDADTTVEKQLVAMGIGADAELLQQQTSEQGEKIAAQLTDRPLLRKQELLDKADQEAASKSESDENGAGLTPTPPVQRHNLLRDDDSELQYLQTNLRRVHRAFFDEYEKKLAGSQGGRVAELRGAKGPKARPKDDLQLVPNIKELMPSIKREVLKGVVIVFSGVFPRHTPLQYADYAIWARSFGAQVNENIDKTTTHVVAHKKGTDKVNKARRRPHIKIVQVSWLTECCSHWVHVDEKPHLLPLDDEGPGRPLFDEPDEGTVLSSSEDDPAATEAEATDDAAAADEEEGLLPSEPTEGHSPIDVTDGTWEAMRAEMDEFLGSDMESDTDSEQSDSSTRDTASNQGKKKRKRATPSAETTDAEESDATATGGLGSKLQRRKKRAIERVSSLNNITTANKSSSGLPSPDTTGPDESKEEGNGDTDVGDADDDAAAFEAEMLAELGRDSDEDGG